MGKNTASCRLASSLHVTTELDGPDRNLINPGPEPLSFVIEEPRARNSPNN
jgi:hypothetical protein